MPEEALLTGTLEPTNESYAIAKIAGIKLCQAYRTQYGSDFISAMPTNLYGPHDNFDLADACVFLMQHYQDTSHINVGTGEEVAIAVLADMVRRIVHPDATIVYDTTKPDALGEGIETTYQWFLAHHAEARGVIQGASGG